jgi:2-polyprenyl-3-methyl-5-hydroxy-6-metoxy-1,4-benzoquinol methylase
MRQSLIRKRGHSIVRFNEPLHFAVDPMPSDEELSRYYSSQNNYGKRWEHTKLEDLPNTNALSVDSLVLEHLQKRGVFLDVGCGDGRLIYHLRKLGWEVVGIDLSDLYVKKCQSYGLDVRQTSFEAAGFDDHSFDVIYMGDVIEHLKDPVRMLKTMREKLKAGGMLAVRTPNAASGYSLLSFFLCRLLKVDWLASEAPAHLNDFSMASLVGYLERTGFDVIHKQFYGRSSLFYCMGATGWLDDEKKVVKEMKGIKRLMRLIPSYPKLVSVFLFVAPVYYLGWVCDFLTNQKSSIEVVARVR